MKKLDNSIIESLREGGAYAFNVVVEERTIRGQLAFTAEKQQICQTAILELDKDDILDEDVQDQIVSFMNENHVIDISLNGKKVWSDSSSSSSKKTVTFFGDEHLSVI